MKRGFYTIMSAQFFSSLADNALLIAAMAMLAAIHAPEWMSPLLKLFFVLSYVLLAAFVGSFADSMPKGRVMFISNLIKVCGCSLMFFDVHPLAAYAVVGFGAAAYSPAKYGILTELLPPEKLVAANGWIEGLTVLSIILGTVLGGVLVNPKISAQLLLFDMPGINSGIDTPAEAALSVITAVYMIAAMFNLRIPDTGVRYRRHHRNPLQLISHFSTCVGLLWRDRLGQISLAVTTLFWGAGATLQFIVIKWADKALNMPLHHASYLQGVVAIGVALGAVAAASMITLRKSLRVLWMGVAMGFVVMAMTGIDTIWSAAPLLILVGLLSGFFVVPMNALLQHRGHILMNAGDSISVQNFNENLSILTMLAVYALMTKMDMSIYTIIIFFGMFVSVTMMLVMVRHRMNQREYDSEALIGEHKH
ncbi:lysophospholipid transporter LplT [Massilia sp. W12]|uniref:lysophospholipid transporter LplT n=1 Tax=Massilia sp. W12 TaxID=3126507 RepID=UPI0030CB9509